ncbi:MAG: hypothetical protein IKD81_07200 [Eubacteriaceae bacterium]|nr:hypothetical protein [Eubacteriaceae bacterium]
METTDGGMRFNALIDSLGLIKNALDEIKATIIETSNSSNYVNNMIGVGTSFLSICGLIQNAKARLLNIEISQEQTKSAKVYASYLDEIAEAFEQIKKDGSGIKETLGNINDVMKELGNNITEGLIKGINGKKITGSIKDVASDVEKTFAVDLEISSPSRVFKRFGQYISEGLALGITEGGGDAVDSVKDMGDKCIDSMEDVGDAADDLGRKKISFGGVFSVVLTAAGALVALFRNLMETNEGFREKVQEAWGRVLDALSPVTEAVMVFFEGFVNGTETTGSAMDVILEIVSGAAEFICGIIGAIGVFWSEHGDGIMAKVREIWQFLVPVAEGIGTLVSGMLGIIMGLFQKIPRL